MDNLAVFRRISSDLFGGIRPIVVFPASYFSLGLSCRNYRRLVKSFPLGVGPFLTYFLVFSQCSWECQDGIIHCRMQLNSFEFICVFLPATIVVFIFLSRTWGSSSAILWLIAASLLFYAWWNPIFTLFLMAAIVSNYFISRAIIHFQKQKKFLLTIGIIFNLSILIYFKYTNFFLQTLQEIGWSHGVFSPIILPLGISFITFQMIAYLVDVYRSKEAGFGFVQYCFFITFFPKLIAGPITRSSEIAPQISNNRAFRFRESNLAVGLTIFVLGLWKKVVFADTLAVYASSIFGAADVGISMNFFESWLGVVAYALQLYFDFSGYADMAIGIARIFSIQLPINFLSPYKSKSIVEFWRTWHITLSNFLCDYLYIPLGGNRKGTLRKYGNLLCTMLIGGLWHGAGWTFVFWGGLHGIFLIVNHWWRTFHFSCSTRIGRNLASFSSWLLTFICTLVAWVFFRAETFGGAWNLLKGMAGFRGIALPQSLLAHFSIPLKQLMLTFGFRFNLVETMVLRPDMFSRGVLWICILFVVVMFAPNTQEFMGSFLPIINPEKHPVPQRTPLCRWSPTTRYAFGIAVLSFISFASLMILQKTEFLYFQF